MMRSGRSWCHHHNRKDGNISLESTTINFSSKNTGNNIIEITKKLTSDEAIARAESNFDQDFDENGSIGALSKHL